MYPISYAARHVLALLAFILLLDMPAIAPAQSQTRPQVGYLLSTRPGPFEKAFEEGLREHGYAPGKNLTIHYRAASGSPDHVNAVVAELIASRVDVIVSASGPGTRAAMKATSSIPIILAASQDAVGDGYVASLARPGGNVTGQSVHAYVLSPKRLELLKEAVPGVSRIAVMWNVLNPRWSQVQEVEAAGKAMGVVIDPIPVSFPDGLNTALTQAAQSGASAAFFVSDTATITYREQIGTLALKHRLATMLSNKAYLDGGGLLSYGPDILDVYRRAAGQVVRVLNGADPADLPVEQPTKFELAINLRTAKALGIELPPALLAQADEVIE